MSSSPTTPEPDDTPLDRDQRPSKTRRKKQSHDLQALGEALAALPDARLAKLVDEGLPEPLLEAIRELKRTKSFEGQRRQLQYVGKLMRKTDPEPLREAVAAMRIPRARETLQLHQAERWRDMLIGDDDAVTRWMAEFPDSDAQQLRSLVRAARKEGAKPVGERQGRSYRELFRFVQQAMHRAGEAADQDDDRDDELDD